MINELADFLDCFMNFFLNINLLSIETEKRLDDSVDRALASSQILQSLPKTIDPLTFAQYRATEIKDMEVELQNAM